MASIDWAKTTARRDEKHLSPWIWCVLYRLYGNSSWPDGFSRIMDLECRVAHGSDPPAWLEVSQQTATISQDIRVALRPVSLRLRCHNSNISKVVNFQHLLKYIFCGVWGPNFVWNFKGYLGNFTQNFEPIHRKICILSSCIFVCELRYLWIMTSEALVRRDPERC